MSSSSPSQSVSGTARAWGSNVYDAGARFVREGTSKVRFAMQGASSPSAGNGAPTSPGAASTAPGATPQVRRKKSIAERIAEVTGAQSNPDPSTLEGHFMASAKERGQDVSSVIQAADITRPYEVEHKVRVQFDEANLRYSGMPESWVVEAHRQYGVPLASIPRTDVPGYKERIPILLVKLRERFVELGGLTAEGVFRLAPDGQDVKEVKYSINTGQALSSLQTTKDPHVVANLIKQFYRELKPKVLTHLTKEQIYGLADVVDDSAAVGKTVALIMEPQLSTFLWLLDLLADVAEKKDVNRMGSQNLAIVLSPNLFDAAPDVTPAEELQLSQKVAVATHACLNWRIDTRKSRR